VGLVGFPNAGKSSLISAMTNAHARIGNYPFTTLSPVIGTLPPTIQDTRTIIVADIPGLIEGAHLGAGLGFDFLRHIERTRLLVFVIDISREAVPSPDHALTILRIELGKYRVDLLRRPWMIAFNKCDLLAGDDRAEWEQTEALILDEIDDAERISRFLLSAKTGESVEGLIKAIREQYSRLTAGEAVRKGGRKATHRWILRLLSLKCFLLLPHARSVAAM
jgi:GTP-binding protein